MKCVVNIGEVRELYLIYHEILKADWQREWLRKAIPRYILRTGRNLVQTVPSECELKDQHVLIAMERGEPLFRFTRDEDIIFDVHDVFDWLVGLEDREPGRARRINRMTFEQARTASAQWHERLARSADKLKVRAIVDDPIGAPSVLDAASLGNGWHWVWLKSSEARGLEGVAMGHCVGNGGYEGLSQGEGVFSLRDPDGIPHVTMHLRGLDPLQSVCKGNSEVTMLYRSSVEEAAAILGLRLFVAHNPCQFSGESFEV